VRGGWEINQLALEAFPSGIDEDLERAVAVEPLRLDLCFFGC
jgi:hypothetical protein